MPTDVLNAHASTLPIHLKVDKILHRAAVRFASLHDTHPLCKQYRLAGARKVKRHRSALHQMAQLYDIKSSEVETLLVVRRNPAKISHLPLTVKIPEDKAASVLTDRNATETIKVYTDGSAINGKVGAAAILMRAGKEDRTLRLCLGTMEEHTVSEAESVGLILGLHLIDTEKHS